MWLSEDLMKAPGKRMLFLSAWQQMISSSVKWKSFLVMERSHWVP